MAAVLTINKETVEGIADAIKDELGDLDKMYPREMSTKIRQISTAADSLSNTQIKSIWDRAIKG